MLEFKNVSYVVPSQNGSGQDTEIIKNVSIKISERFVAITGPNGSGKSTMAKLVAGIIKPTEGRIYFDGTDITDMSITERANLGIGYAFQQPVRFKGITVKDLISMAAEKNINIHQACEYLSEVGLCAKEYINREVNASLSGGELKRIEIAMVNARNTSFTVFDEPEAGIDLWSFNSLIDVFKKMYDRTKGTILIISHQERILDIADRVIVISGGVIADDGTKEEVLPTLLSQSAGCCQTRNGTIGKTVGSREPVKGGV